MDKDVDGFAETAPLVDGFAETAPPGFAETAPPGFSEAALPRSLPVRRVAGAVLREEAHTLADTNTPLAIHKIIFEGRREPEKEPACTSRQLSPSVACGGGRNRLEAAQGRQAANRAAASLDIWKMPTIPSVSELCGLR